MRHIIALIFTLALIPACAPKTAQLPDSDPILESVESMRQHELAAKATHEMEKRLFRVAGRVLYANPQFCDDKVAKKLGIRLTQMSHIKPEWRHAIGPIYGYPQGVFIAHIYSGSHAIEAGLKVGDTILGVDGAIAPRAKQYKNAGADDVANADTMVVIRRVAKSIKERGEAEISAYRKGELIQTVVKATLVPNIGIQLVNNPSINAFTDGKRIAVFTGMMRFCKTDDELAVIIGHELAHAALDHVEAKRGNALLGSLLDILVAGTTGVGSNIGGKLGSMAFSQDFEREADYIGLYMAARAGYDVSNAANIWRRMGVEYPEAITHASTHPNTASRYVQIDATAKEIAGKAQSGPSLMPNIRRELSLNNK